MKRIDIGFILKLFFLIAIIWFLFYIGKDKNVNYKGKGYYETR